MKTLTFLLAIMLFCITCFAQQNDNIFSSFERAKLHPLTFDKPAIDFFEGALLGNGAMGAVVTTRPDGIMIYFGHNNVWDIRLAEDNKEALGTFEYVFNKVKAIPDTLRLLTDDPWYSKYSKMAAENYRKPYPRPFPCGSVLLGFDRRNAEMLGHKLDISNGLCEVYLLTNEKEKITLQIFTDMLQDKLWMQLVDKNGKLCESIFDRVKVMPDPSTPKEFPQYTTQEDLEKGLIAFRQVMPYQEPEDYNLEKGHHNDKAFSLTVQFNSSLEKTNRIDWNGNLQEMALMEGSFVNKNNFIGCILLTEGLNSKVPKMSAVDNLPSQSALKKSFENGTKIWKEYWNKSGVSLSDSFLERTWYHNLYFFNCAVKKGVSTPGLFANWSFNDIGTAWHGDYHMNYNTQQPFWLPFSTNHLEKNLSYVELIEFLMDVSQKWAKEYYNLPGAYFPHSAYPVDMTMNPYPVPHWGWEIFETPWAVQGLWWHYLYSKDIDFLRDRAYFPIKAAVEFLVAYMKRPEARGEQWKDNNYHVFPAIPPELYALRPGFKYNYDCTMDLTLTKFIFKAFRNATTDLGIQDEEKDLLADIEDILNNFPDYPTAITPDNKEVLVSVPEEHSQVVYNVPNALATVFPGEDYGLHSDQETMNLLKNTFSNRQNEGGNDIVFYNLQAARIGLLDLERFKRQINYSLMPNGTASDRVMQVHGRYRDQTNYGFMDRMGVWFENFALPVVINECLMQSYNGTIRLFPNWPLDKDAEFHNLRAVGAFLVSASLKDSKVSEIEIFSEAGSTLKLVLPWENCTMKNSKGKTILKSKLVKISTQKGETLKFEAK
ncbi:glycoside hydrolase N-terminal domain-containing protein [Prolixibacteraceae bacterium Z1-6]|uniref:Glycoside hydrolase N-terminal domain-containing protein n=1 Tax=Draconibacterium aestuarii TaxID=2998507 RepID=A0A9X3F2K5_9BACT|nr:glycoside hydrolase N-terminal domain-containing protein [Prolixibacteraceae bacterium Z1-6]